jgi:hypothetical protein
MSGKESQDGNTGWTPEPVQEAEPRTRISHIIEIFLWVMLVGIVASVAIPEYAGHPIAAEALPGALFGFVLLPFLIARVRRAGRPWLYSLAGVVVFFGLAALGGAKQGLDTRGQENELYAALEQFEPETGKAARAAAKNPALLKSILPSAIRRAAQRAADADLVAYNKELFGLIETKAGVDRQRCAEVTLGEKQRPHTTAEELRIGKATAQLFRAASSNAEPVIFDMDRAMALHGEVVRAADREGVTADPARLAAMTRDEHCDLYLRMMKNLNELPLADAALVMRGNMASRAPN